MGCEDVLIEKPNPESLFYAITFLRLTKEEVLYVGDSIIDVRTAMNASVDFTGVTIGTTKREEFLDYSYVKILEHLEELPCIIYIIKSHKRNARKMYSG